MRQIGPDRIRCVVVGCGRTAPRERHPGANEIICGKCWRTVPRRLRRRYYRLSRLWRRAPEGSRLAFRLYYVEQRLWKQIVASAIEVKVGIAA